MCVAFSRFFLQEKKRNESAIVTTLLPTVKKKEFAVDEQPKRRRRKEREKKECAGRQEFIHKMTLVSQAVPNAPFIKKCVCGISVNKQA